MSEITVMLEYVKGSINGVRAAKYVSNTLINCINISIIYFNLLVSYNK